MARLPISLRLDAAKVDDATDAGLLCRGGEVFRRAGVPTFEFILSRRQRVDQVVGDVDVPERVRQRIRLERIRFDHLDAVAPRTLCQPFGIARKAAYAKPQLQQPRNKSAANVAGGSRNQYQRTVRHQCLACFARMIDFRGLCCVDRYTYTRVLWRLHPDRLF